MPTVAATCIARVSGYSTAASTRITPKSPESWLAGMDTNNTHAAARASTPMGRVDAASNHWGQFRCMARVWRRPGLPTSLLAIIQRGADPVSYTHLRAHETPEHLVCRLLLE